MLDLNSVVFKHLAPGIDSNAILAVANFANINSNEYFCPEGTQGVFSSNLFKQFQGCVIAYCTTKGWLQSENFVGKCINI